GNQSQPSLSSVGMFTSGGQATRSKYCRRHGSASQIGIDAQFDWNIVFIVDPVGWERRALGAPCPRRSSMPRKTLGRFALPTLPTGRQRSSNVSAWIEKFAPASVHVAAGVHPDPRAKAAKYSSVYL